MQERAEHLSEDVQRKQQEVKRVFTVQRSRDDRKMCVMSTHKVFDVCTLVLQQTGGNSPHGRGIPRLFANKQPHSETSFNRKIFGTVTSLNHLHPKSPSPTPHHQLLTPFVALLSHRGGCSPPPNTNTAVSNTFLNTLSQQQHLRLPNLHLKPAVRTL